uniref:Uncharacterized protein n=1 Tax=Oryza meridionalis TaxID=40149 RepID=A0A0E0DH55_9ORYZ
MGMPATEDGAAGDGGSRGGVRARGGTSSKTWGKLYAVDHNEDLLAVTLAADRVIDGKPPGAAGLLRVTLHYARFIDASLFYL